MSKEEYRKLKEELIELETQFNNPAVISDPEKTAALSRRYAEVKEAIANYEKLAELEKNLAENKNLLDREVEEGEMKKLFEEDIRETK